MTVAGPVDMAVVRNRKRKMVEALVQMHLDRYKATGAELIIGEAIHATIFLHHPLWR